MNNLEHIPVRCRHRGRLSMGNNPIKLARKRYWLLERRMRCLRPLARKVSIEYSEGGTALALYPNLDPRQERASRLVCEMREEQKEIAKFLKESGAWK